MDDGQHASDRGIGQQLKAARKALKLTLSQTSERTGVSVSGLSKIENGLVSPSFDVIKRICDGLDLPLEELVAKERVAAGPRPQDGDPQGRRRTLHQRPVRLLRPRDRALPQGHGSA